MTNPTDDIEQSLRLGIHVEIGDPTLAPIVSSLTDAQISWISSWLAGESFERRSNTLQRGLDARDLATARAQAANFRRAIAEALEELPEQRPDGAIGTAVHRAATCLRNALDEAGTA